MEKKQKKCECGCEEHNHENSNEIKFNTPNDLVLKVLKDNKESLIEEECCTAMTIILKNDGQICTSFLGSHNPYILKELAQAQKMYFKVLKKALKEEYNHSCTCDECDSHEKEHDHEHKHDEKDECHCTPSHNCGCIDEKGVHHEDKCSCDKKGKTIASPKIKSSKASKTKTITKEK